MRDPKALYQQLILEHNRRPCNHKKMPQASHEAQGFNPLCGDQLQLYLKVEEERLAALSFQGKGCAISQASASMMTSILKGLSLTQALSVQESFLTLLQGKLSSEKTQDLGKLAVFGEIWRYPSRVKCASLAWHTLKEALEGPKESL